MLSPKQARKLVESTALVSEDAGDELLVVIEELPAWRQRLGKIIVLFDGIASCLKSKKMQRMVGQLRGLDAAADSLLNDCSELLHELVDLSRDIRTAVTRAVAAKTDEVEVDEAPFVTRYRDWLRRAEQASNAGPWEASEGLGHSFAEMGDLLSEDVGGNAARLSKMLDEFSMPEDEGQLRLESWPSPEELRGIIEAMVEDEMEEQS